MIVAETFASRISQFHINPNGSLGERELWADPTGGDNNELLFITSSATSDPKQAKLQKSGRIEVYGI